MKNYLFLLIMLHAANMGFSQKYKYGKVNMELMELKDCDFYKDASAMVTYSQGNCDVRYYEKQGFKSEFKVKKQIKLFNNDSKDAGNIEIYYYSPKGSGTKVKMISVEGKTYTLVSGKIEETKLNKDNIFETQYNNYVKKITLAVPNLTNSSVFEYEYSLVSEYYTNIDDWVVQENHPVLYNEFTTTVPQYYKYQINILGGIAPVKDEKTEGTQVINFTSIEDKGNLGRTVVYDRVPIELNIRKIVFEQIPPAEEEPFAPNISDMAAKVTHQLVIIQWPNEPIRNIATSYESVNKELLDSENFGKRVKDGDFISKMIEDIPDKDPKIIGAQVLDYFRKNVKWDGGYHYRTDKSGKALFKDGTGDVGDINLNYIAALNHMGVQTFPVLLSTRGNGTLHPNYPDYSDFNYVVAVSLIDEQLYFSDVVLGMPWGSLPIQCINGEGWIVSESGGTWINLKGKASGKHIALSEIKKSGQSLAYTSKIQRSGYFAYDDNSTMLAQSEEKWLEKTFTEIGMKSDEPKILEKKADLIKMQCTHTMDIDDDDIIYIKPFISLPWTSNPFTREKRFSLVDLPFAREYKYISNIHIEAGYTVEVPPPLHAMLDDQNSISIKYTATLQQETQKLIVIADIKINKTTYIPSEYPDLKATIESILKKLNEPIVLKKNV
ncbi:MAG: hypothetical protein WBO36_02085 [Saprospiraceae bacterium]